MASTNSYNFGRSVNQNSMAIERASSINKRSNGLDYDSYVRKNQSSIKHIPKIVLKAGFPQISIDIKTPQIEKILDIQEKANVWTPAPPIARTQLQNILYKAVKKFRNKYQYIWVLVAQQKHPTIQSFNELYQFQRMTNINHTLQNLLIPEDFERIFYFTKEGMSIKLLTDYYSWNKYLKNHIGRPQNSTDKLMEVYVEGQNNRGILSSRKVKSVEDLKIFIEQEVKMDVENSRKDKPYYNFVHQNSGPQFFTRRSIIKNCLNTKPKQELAQNNTNFIKLLHKFNKEQHQKRMKEARKIGGITMEQRIIQTNQKYQKWEGLIKQYQIRSRQCLQKFYPLQEQRDQIKEIIYNEMICQYSAESPVYYLVNNTLRFSTNNENARPLSMFVRYLYDSIKYYFLNNYRMQSNLSIVYRGGRVSLTEQRSLVEKRYILNLGFMSTSRSKKVAEDFLRGDDQQSVLFVIKIPQLASQLDYLSEQQGFYCIDKIPEVRSRVKLVAKQLQVLFNPLNIFQIEKWNNNTKVLTLIYAPHLQILSKKRNKQALTPQQQGLLKGISQFKDTNFDKGQQLLEEGDPSGAVKYYEQSNDSGEQLSFTQKSNYIKGLMQVGDLERMQTLLKEELQAEKNAQNQILENSTVASSLEKLADSVQSITLLQQTNNFTQADERAENLVVQTVKKSIDMPNQQTLLLQAKAYIELSKVKHGVSQTLDSINYSVKGLKLLDQMAHVNFCFRIFKLGNELKKIPIHRLQINEKLAANVLYIMNQNQFLNLQIQEQKQKFLDKLAEIRIMDAKNQFTESTKNSKKIKQGHQNAQKILQQYFYKERATRSGFQNLQQKFVYASWQLSTLKIKNSQQMPNKEYVEWKKKLKQLEQDFFMVRKDYMDLFQNQKNAYEVLYKNIYKTSIDVSPFLESYHKNLYKRYENFINASLQNDGNTLQAVQFYWKYADILYEYSQIIERPKNKDHSNKTESENLAEQKIQKAQNIILAIEERQKQKLKGNINTYTYQKNEINRIMTRYFKSKTIDKQQARKLSIIKQQEYKTESIKNSLKENVEKGNDFNKMVALLDSNKQLCSSDPNINKATFQIKIACEKIEVLNESSNILVQSSSYVQRLKSCKIQYEDVMNTIQKYNEKQIMQRNLNMAQLNLLMSENQFRLGIIQNSKKYLKQARTCLKKILKIDEIPEKQRQNTHQINKEKLMLGNNTFIGIKRLQSHIVAFFGNLQQKKLLYQELVSLKQKMFETMNEPLNEADMNQSIGLIASNMLIIYKELNFDIVSKYYLDAIALRQKLLGPYNKFIARDYSLIAKLISIQPIKEQHYKELKKYYEQAVKIYGRIDMSLESTIILHRMQVRSTYFIFTFNKQMACRVILEDLQNFDNCPNKQIALETAQELFRCASYLSQQQQFIIDSLDWLKYTYQYIKTLQKFVQRISQVSESKRKRNINGLKVDVLKQIAALQLKIEGDDLEEYYSLYKEQKQKYDELLKQNSQCY